MRLIGSGTLVKLSLEEWKTAITLLQSIGGHWIRLPKGDGSALRMPDGKLVAEKDRFGYYLVPEVLPDLKRLGMTDVVEIGN